MGTTRFYKPGAQLFESSCTCSAVSSPNWFHVVFRKDIEQRQNIRVATSPLFVVDEALVTRHSCEYEAFGRQGVVNDEVSRLKILPRIGHGRAVSHLVR